MTSLITRLPSAFSNTALVKAYRDPILNPGSRFLFDVSNTDCCALAVGGLTSGQTLTNLVDGAPVATVSSSDNPMTNNGFNGGGEHLGISLAAAASNGASFVFGTTYDLQDLGTPNHDFLVLAWIRMNTTQVASQNYSTILTLGGPGTDLFNMDGGNANGEPRGVANSQGGAPGHSAFTGFVKDVPQQLGVAYKWNSGTPFYELYLNGAPVALIGMSNTNFADMTANSVGWGNARLAGKLYAAYMEDLSLSGASALEKVEADYAFRSGRFAA